MRYEQTKPKVHIELFVDSDWANDKSDRKSITGFILLANGGPVAYGAKKQTITADSTAEAEYIALSVGTKKLKWLLLTLKFLGVEYCEPVTVWCDNESARKLLNPNVNNQRTKHLDTKFHVSRQIVAQFGLEVKHINSNENIADMLTKIPEGNLFEQCRAKVLSYP